MTATKPIVHGAAGLLRDWRTTAPSSRIPPAGLYVRHQDHEVDGWWYVRKGLGAGCLNRSARDEFIHARRNDGWSQGRSVVAHAPDRNEP